MLGGTAETVNIYYVYKYAYNGNFLPVDYVITCSIITDTLDKTLRLYLIVGPIAYTFDTIQLGTSRGPW